MNAQFEDERAQAARQLAPRLVRFALVSVMVCLIQVIVVAALLVGNFLRGTDAHGVTQSGEVFKLEPIRK